MSARVVIVQPYVPHYRVAFFEGLVRSLGEAEIECRIAVSGPSGEQKLRKDASEASAWMETFRSRRLTIGTRTLDLGGSSKLWSNADGVVLGFQGTLLDSYRALLSPRVSRVALWGHIANYVSPPNVIDTALETWQARHADHIFAYTPSGAQEAVRLGAANGKVTTVMNAIETNRLIELFNYIDSEQTQAFRKKHGLTAGMTLGFIGGLDKSKRVDLLADTLEILWKREPRLKLLVGGRGAHEPLLASAVSRGQVVHLGYADDAMIAMVAAVSEAIVIPGRIGLVAVQTLALGIPLLTTDYRYHAPEYEYLTAGSSVYSSVEEAHEFADLIEEYLGISTGAIPGQWNYPSMKSMISNFHAGIVKMLST